MRIQNTDVDFQEFLLRHSIYKRFPCEGFFLREHFDSVGFDKEIQIVCRTSKGAGAGVCTIDCGSDFKRYNVEVALVKAIALAWAYAGGRPHVPFRLYRRSPKFMMVKGQRRTENDL